MLPQNSPIRHFNLGMIFVLFHILAGSIFLFIHGKYGSFQLINGNYGQMGDFFFKYFTYMGDAMLWIPLVLYCFLYRKEFVLSVLAGFIVSTILTQFLKRVVFPSELRPITFLASDFPIHIIDGVTMKRAYSFPSGHTGTAYTMALLLTYIVNRNSWSIIFPLIAFLAGYSRVYLGQHFATDVVAGMCVGMISALVGVTVYRKAIRKPKSKVSHPPRT